MHITIEYNNPIPISSPACVPGPGNGRLCSVERSLWGSARCWMLHIWWPMAKPNTLDTLHSRTCTWQCNRNRPSLRYLWKRKTQTTGGERPAWSSEEIDTQTDFPTGSQRWQRFQRTPCPMSSPIRPSTSSTRIGFTALCVSLVFSCC